MVIVRLGLTSLSSDYIVAWRKQGILCIHWGSLSFVLIKRDAYRIEEEGVAVPYIRAFFVCLAIRCIQKTARQIRLRLRQSRLFFYYTTTLSCISVLVLCRVSRLNLICDTNQLLLNFFESRSLLHIACKPSQAEADDRGTEQPRSTTV
jgi:hypothetical protein